MTSTRTDPGRRASGRLTRRAYGEGVCAIAATLVVRIVVSAVAAGRAGVSAFRSSSWAHWDSGLYMDIAAHGYTLGRCGELFPTGPYATSDWCGNAGWFPLYPLLIRTGTALGLNQASAGHLISAAFFVVALTIVWFGFLQRLPKPVAYVLLVLAAFFPGSVYYGAVFPVSLTVCSALLVLVLLSKKRYLWAGVAGAVGVAAYPSFILIGFLAVVPLWSRGRPSTTGKRLRAAATYAAPLIVSYGLVLFSLQLATGHWNAWFMTQAKYQYGQANPFSIYWERFTPLRNPSFEHPDGPALQTAFVLLLVVLVVFCAVRQRGSLFRLDMMAASYAVAFWLGPLVLGGQLSVYRSEALLVPAVVTLQRLPKWLLAVVTLMAMLLAGAMDYLFFSNYLI